MSVISIHFNDDEEIIIKEYLKAKKDETLNLISFEEAIKEWDIE